MSLFITRARHLWSGLRQNASSPAVLFSAEVADTDAALTRYDVREIDPASIGVALAKSGKQHDLILVGEQMTRLEKRRVIADLYRTGSVSPGLIIMALHISHPINCPGPANVGVHEMNSYVRANYPEFDAITFDFGTAGGFVSLYSSQRAPAVATAARQSITR